MNSVQYILRNRPLSRQDKITIKGLGRTVPELCIMITTVGKSRDFNRYFKRETTYDKFPWMCGCPETNKLYCFVCLVCGDSASSQWTNQGVSDLQHLQERAAKHFNSAAHLNHLVDFNTLGASDAPEQLDSAYLRTIANHNDTVGVNRQVLSRWISCLKLYGQCELATYERDRHDREVFRGLVDLISKVDHTSPHLSQSTADVEESIQNQLLDVMLRVCKDEISDQVNRSNFVALLAELTCDGLLVIIFRYFFEGRVFERLWDVVQLETYTAESISQVVLRELDAVGLQANKLIAQTSNVSFSMFEEVEVAIRAKYPNAYFVHAYCHHFNKVLSNAAFPSLRMKIFFGDIKVFATFFSQIPKRREALEEVFQKSLPFKLEEPWYWNFKTGAVQELYGKTELFLECLEKIRDEFRHWETISKADNLVRSLESEDFDYFVEVVYHAIPHVELFFNQVEAQTADGRFIRECVVEFESRISERIDALCSETRQSATDDEFTEVDVKYFQIKQELTGEDDPPSPKRPCLEIVDTFGGGFVKMEIDSDEGLDASTSAGPKRLCLEVTEPSEQILIAKEYYVGLTNELKKRFSFTGYMSATALFCSGMKDDLEDILEDTIKSYPFLDGAKLKTELAVIHNRKDMQCSGTLPLLTFIQRNNLQEGFSEAYKLLDVICTTPMITAEAERCFATIQRVKTFLKTTEGQQRINALAMLSMEHKMVQSIPDFDNKVINIFAESELGAEFKYM